MVKTIELSNDGIKEIQTIILDLGNILADKELMIYLEKRCEKELNHIVNREILNNWDNEEIWNYRNSFHAKVYSDTVFIYNDSTIDIAEKIANADGKSHIDPNAYPERLSLAKMVEYGVGIVGEINTDSAGVDDSWQYDVNNHGGKGWTYYNSDLGQFVTTTGTEGKLIFYKLKNCVKENIKDWIKDYVESEMKKKG